MPEAQEESYIRGAGAVVVDGRRVFAVLAVLVVAGLVAVTAYLYTTTASHNSAADALARNGVTVNATIVGCDGISDGVGMGVEYYDCTAQVSLDGRSYSAPLHGSRTSRAVGSEVTAFMVPGDGATLTLGRPRPSSYTAAWVMAVVTVVTVVAAMVLARFFGRRRLRPRDPAPRAT